MKDLAETLATYEAVADTYRERHSDRKSIAQFLDRFFDLLEGNRVLDVGCGPGWESATMSEAGKSVVGIDLTSAFLTAARSEAPDTDFARMDMRRLGLAEETFDGIWACASFLHIPRENAPATLREFRRVLAPGGTLFLAVKRGSGTRTGDGYAEDERTFTLYEPPELRRLVEEAGFEIVRLDAEEAWVQVYATA